MTGYPEDTGKQVEVLNNDGQPESCPSIQNYPLGLRGAMGGLLNDKVVICGGTTSTRSKDATNKCYQLGDNGQWAPFGAALKQSKRAFFGAGGASLKSARYFGAAASVTIQGEEYLWITGGVDAR